MVYPTPVTALDVVYDSIIHQVAEAVDAFEAEHGQDYDDLFFAAELPDDPVYAVYLYQAFLRRDVDPLLFKFDDSDVSRWRVA